jgi:hypothetical protein
MSTRRTRRSAWPDRITLAKDVLLFLIGAAMMAYQAFVVPRPDFNWAVMVFGGIVAGVPGVLKLWAVPSTGGPSLPLPEQPSPLPPSSSSSA